MRHVVSALLLLTLAGCGHAALPAASLEAGRAVALAETPALDLTAALARFTKQEKRKVTATHLQPTDGKGGATLSVPLSAKDKTMLVQLYRLNPLPVEPDQFPAGVLERAADQIAVLHHFELPGDEALDAAAMRTKLRPRGYFDGDQKLMAVEAFMKNGTYQLAAKYDLKGRLLQVDMITWQ
ncbi:MAG: hypothetical protein JWM80_5951 [Cyanobacteria bacterium RYN_339]|nr:hypothetical protein [Cyanobacteria bacterium RYN_339]